MKERWPIYLQELYSSELILNVCAKLGNDKYIPHTECWYPADLPISRIEAIMTVNIPDFQKESGHIFEYLCRH